MTAAFKIADECFWGTNGAIEAYAEALTLQATDRFGPDATLSKFFREAWEGFYSGKIVFLDDLLVEEVGRNQFLEILDAATQQLLHERAFTEYGTEWVSSVITKLRARVSAN